MKEYVQKIFEAGIHAELDEWERRSVRLLNRLIFISVIGAFLFGIIDVFNGYYEVTAVFFIVLTVGLVEQFLVKRRYYNAAKYMLFIFITLWGVTFSLIAGGRAGAQYILLPVSMMPALIFRSRRVSIILFTVAFMAFITTVYLQKMISPMIILADHLVFPYTILAAFMMMLVIFLLTHYSKSLTNDYEKIIVQKNEQLSGAYKDIKDSIVYAKRLQEAILPSEAFLKKHLPKSFILYKPKDIVAGDFYWFHIGESLEFKDESTKLTQPPTFNSQLFIAAADCTGHGVPGAMVSVVCSNALNRAVVELGISDPGKILDKVRDLVIETFEKSKEDVKDGMDISLLSIRRTPNSELATLGWAGANNPLWYISGGEFKEIKPDKQPIGKHLNPKPFTTHSIELKKDDTVFLFTDGYADQFGGPKGKKFKYKQLAELLLNNRNIHPEEQGVLLEKKFEEWRGGHEQIDDVCIIGIKL